MEFVGLARSLTCDQGAKESSRKSENKASHLLQWDLKELLAPSLLLSGT